jgi:hypothetical protein
MSKTLYTTVVKLPASTTEHIPNTLFQFAVFCKMVVHPLEGQTGGSRRVPDLGSKQNVEE